MAYDLKKMEQWEKDQCKLQGEMIKSAFALAKQGYKVKWDDPYQILDFGCSVVSTALGFIPVFGPAFSSIFNFFTALFMPSSGASDIWPKIAERVKAIAKAEVTSYHLETISTYRASVQTALSDLQGALDAGNANNANIYVVNANQQLVNLINKTTQATGDVQALPAFAALADVRLSLLVSAIRGEHEWGMIDKGIVDNFRRSYNAATKVGNSVVRGTEDDGASQQALIRTLQDIVQNGDASPDALAVAANLIADLQTPAPQLEDVDVNGEYSYVEQARKVYWKGYKGALVNGTEQDGWWRTPGGRDNAEKSLDQNGYRRTVISQYESLMRIAVVQKALMWPHMLSGEIPSSVRKQLNQPIRYHYGRGGPGSYELESPTDDQVVNSWTVAPQWDRPAPVSWIQVWWGDEVDGVNYWRIKGSNWEGGDRDNSQTAANSRVHTEEDSDYFTAVGVIRNTSYPKLGSLCFQRASDELDKVANSKDKAGWAKDESNRDEFGRNHFGGGWSYASPGTGWQLSDITVPLMSNTDPKGPEGVVFWFQPVINYEKDPN
ncbi:insecticidal delta-endotoxin Cry8Ea1 family protein [Streptomyces pathocidini]|uniref:insecticidal delta-endotoxin Cry8Ea1 family protein n=1 Tax=Streptomyces pathocidini TaxID=1650571 RepID=UPI0034075E12